MTSANRTTLLSNMIACGARIAFAIAAFACNNGAYASTESAPDLPLSLMDHRMWTARDGAPQGVRVLVQGQDGLLWIGTEGGLFNFDGNVFRAFNPRGGEPNLSAGPVNALHVARDGALWAGTVQGVGRILDGRVTLHKEVGGKPVGSVLFLTEAADGTVWASHRGGLFRFAVDGSDHQEPAPLPVETNPVGGIFIDSSNTLWIGQSGKLYRRALDGTEYEPTDIRVDYIFGFYETGDGSLWITDVDTKLNVGRHQHIDSDGTLIGTAPDSMMAFSILPAPDGSVIISTQGYGLRRFRKDQLTATPTAMAPLAEKFARVDGLSADEPRGLLLDSDGNIWSGNRRGLDRFRPAQLMPFLPEASREGGSGWSVCANPQGEVLVGNVHAIYKASSGIPQPLSKGDEDAGWNPFCAPDGDVWWINGHGINTSHADQISRVPPIPGVINYGVRQVIADAAHSLYAIAYLPPAAAGVWNYRQGTWSKLPDNAGGSPPLSEYLDRDARLWVGRHQGVIELPLENRVLSSGTPGLDGVFAFLETSRGLFAAGGNGLAVLRQTDFQMLTFADPASARGVGGLIDSADGDLWLNASRGIVHLRAHELEAGLEDPAYPMKSELISEGDFVGPADLAHKSAAARDAKGNLWFATVNGVFHFDPAHLVPNTHLPVVSIRSLSVDGKPIGADMAIGPRPQTLLIQYLGVNLTVPERVAYRYRLEGLEDTWQDAGHRTEAIYTQLPPGTYTFQVMASNGDDRWTAPVATSAFIVTAAFDQTVWFKMIIAAAALLIVFGVLGLRLRAVARNIRNRAEARADERIRIARDLHDTLLQGVQGLLLNVHVAAAQAPDGSAAKSMLQRALLSADNLILEGRDRVSRLRAEHLTDAELIGSIENIGADLASGDGPSFSVTRCGESLPLHAHVVDETFHIAREALTNAFRHADATRIEIRLIYGRRFFELVCVDNGRGFKPAEADKRGHWGFQGMIERAARLGGRLQCSSESELGTTITLEVPSYRAYRNGSRATFYFGNLAAKIFGDETGVGNSKTGEG
jgi:signal transduction histidine kinase